WVKEKIHIVHCGILPEKYQPQERTWQVGDRFEIITTGSLQPYKGQKYLVEACAILRDKGIPFRCRFIGGGEEYEDLAQRIAAHDLEAHVFLLGSKTQDEVAELLATAHCYTQPSIITPSGKMEGIPVALMEAMAGQLPVLATELSGIPELVRPGETGYLVPPADAAALAEALEKIYNAPEEAAQRAAAGRQLVLDEFELRDNVKQLSALFERFIER
ncbi:MAG: glycosyltransferase, partial [Anaerolineales bacterium]|nr:glycosyltransferase [Anaerolineales bacterium]